MQKMKSVFLIGVVASMLFIGCSKNEPIIPIPEPPAVVIKDGLNYSPEAPDADKELTITFKAASSSALYGYAGNVYIHTGVIAEGTWIYVPAAWDQNLDKCKMTKISDNTWSITLSPSIRQWFASGETSV